MSTDFKNRCAVTGPASDIDEFRRRMFAHVDEFGHEAIAFDFRKILPNGDWGTSNSWALKWLSEDPLVFTFCTANGTPESVFEALAREFPSIRFFCETYCSDGYLNDLAMAINTEAPYEPLPDWETIFGQMPEFWNEMIGPWGLLTESAGDEDVLSDLYQILPLFDRSGKRIRDDKVTRCQVTGPASDLEAFRRRMFVRPPEEGWEAVVFDFNRIIPLHDVSETQDRWGTVGNSYQFSLTSENPLEFKFITNGGVPIPVFEALAREFPSLHFLCEVMWSWARFYDAGCNEDQAWDTYFGEMPRFASSGEER